MHLYLRYPLFRLLLLCLLLSGCAGLTPDMDPPRVTVESFRSLPSENIGPRFEIKLRVANPNKQSLDIVGISYTIAVLDREVISGVTNEVPLLEPYSDEVVTLEAGINMFQFLRLLSSLGREPTDSLAYKFSAKIDFNGFIPTQRVEEEGEFALR
jgi:LEA14-like dessication related protein